MTSGSFFRFSRYNIFVVLAVFVLSAVWMTKYLPLYTIPLYGLYLLSVILFFKYFKFPKIWYKYMFFVGAVVAVFVFIGVINLVGPQYDSRLDRDDMLEATTECMLNGKSPYAANWTIISKDGRIFYGADRNINVLPVTLVSSFIFYFTGNVAYQDILGFLIMLYLIHRLYSRYRTRAFMLFFLSGQVLMLAEFTGQNDLLFAISLMMLGIFYMYKKKILSLSIFISLALLTRNVMIIPLSVCMGYIIRHYRIRQIIRISVISAIVAALFIIPFLIIDSTGLITSVVYNSIKYIPADNYCIKHLFDFNYLYVFLPVTMTIGFIGGMRARSINKLYFWSGMAFFIFLSMSYCYMYDPSHLIWPLVPFVLSLNLEKNN